jgi:hypothetical protein
MIENDIFYLLRVHDMLLNHILRTQMQFKLQHSWHLQCLYSEYGINFSMT